MKSHWEVQEIIIVDLLPQKHEYHARVICFPQNEFDKLGPTQLRNPFPDVMSKLVTCHMEYFPSTVFLCSLGAKLSAPAKRPAIVPDDDWERKGLTAAATAAAKKRSQLLEENGWKTGNMCIEDPTVFHGLPWCCMMFHSFCYGLVLIVT